MICISLLKKMREVWAMSYEKAVMEVITLETEDVITTSGEDLFGE